MKNITTTEKSLLARVNERKLALRDALRNVDLPRGERSAIADSFSDSDMKMTFKTALKILKGGTGEIDDFNPQLNGLIAILLLLEDRGCSIDLGVLQKNHIPQHDQNPIENSIWLDILEESVKLSIRRAVANGALTPNIDIDIDKIGQSARYDGLISAQKKAAELMEAAYKAKVG